MILDNDLELLYVQRFSNWWTTSP